MSENKGMNGKDLFIGAVIGGVIGATAALLLAPKSGRETREDLSRSLETAKGVMLEKTDQLNQRAHDVKDTATDKWIEIRDTASSTVKEVASTVEDWKDTANRKWSEVRDQAGDRVEEAAVITSDKVEEVASKTSEKVEELGEEVSDQLKS
ncbi:YtxH domain-containing protein [Desmospora profundinema]|uniref:Gas vesicle protein n=1 Tax=Desmospora profundinema TaxID=1571184 RepID=A0ABU1IRL2_9BACL|nr:YtxH domain-containing protein [Desmospora profundinema]MDR6227435.1 gas vesicle protein [Desmospora profundinema]